ncbi:MAG TPA: CapA family protein, partial [Gemmatimonadaceae bacterium]|nr:CapA family protein [Gemmatimonadaceae bacterium]
MASLGEQYETPGPSTLQAGEARPSDRHGVVKLFLCGDVMLGRGVDQILPDSCPPALLEPYVDSALDYVKLAERAHGPIPRPVDYAYVWGVARDILDAEQPDVRIVNLETSVTTSDDAEPKGINYRMHPRNVAILSAARIDCCVLANNHVLDWGGRGLLQTLETLRAAGIQVTGAGEDLERASAPSITPLSDGRRVLVFGLGASDSGIPPHWAARSDRPGVNWLGELSRGSVRRVQQLVSAVKRRGDIAVASIHWGPNWGYEIPRDHRHFAHALI